MKLKKGKHMVYYADSIVKHTESIARQLTRLADTVTTSVEGADDGGTIIAPGKKQANYPRTYACMRAKDSTGAMIPPTVVFVDNGNDDGEGSFRAACAAKHPAKAIAIRYGGLIRGKSGELVLSTPYTTIFGQTAPANGLTLTGSTLSLKSHDIDVTYMHLRRGDEVKARSHDNGDCLDIATGAAVTSDITVANCSLSSAVDELMHVTGHYRGGNTGLTPEERGPMRNFLSYRNIFDSALSLSKHSKGEHSKAVISGYYLRDARFRECIFAHCRDRVPKIDHASSVALLNNIFHGNGAYPYFDPNSRTVDPLVDPLGISTQVAFCGNVMMDRSGTITHKRGSSLMPPALRDLTKLFLSGNFSYSPYATKDDLSAHWRRLLEDGTPHPDNVILVDKWPEELALWPEGTLSDKKGTHDPWYPADGVLSRMRYIGARPARRNQMDRRLIESINNRTYKGDPDKFVPVGTFGADYSGRYPDTVADDGGFDETLGEHQLDVPTDTTRIPEWMESWTYKADVSGDY